MNSAILYFTVLSNIVAGGVADNKESSTISFPDLPQMVSCKGECGMKPGGCSCTENCVVYSNCCEDFVEECPILANRSTVIENNLPLSMTRCTAEQIIVVSGCPSNRAPSAGTLAAQFAIFQETTPLADSVSENCWRNALEHESRMTATPKPVSGSLPEIMVLAALNNLYVTDRSTGIVYDNIELFLCHARPRSVPCLWDVSTNGRYVQEPTDIDYKRLYYTPPNDTVTDSQNIAFCVEGAVDNCDENSAFYSQELSDMCRAFRSPVKYFENRKIYQNRYCFVCIKGRDAFDDNIIYVDPLLKQTTITNKFSILVGLTTGLTITLDTSGNLEGKISWNSATCDMSVGMSCQVGSCSGGFALRPDGECKKMYFMHLAIHMTEVPSTPKTLGENPISKVANPVTQEALQETQRVDMSMTPAIHQKVANLLRCVAEKHLEFDFQKSPPLVLRSTYNVFPNLTMYGASIPFYDSDHTSHFYTMETFSRAFGNPVAQIVNHVDEINPKKTKGESLFSIQEMMVERRTFDNSNMIMMNQSSNSSTPPKRLSPFCSCTSMYHDLATCPLVCFYQLDKKAEWARRVGSLKEDDCISAYQAESAATQGGVALEGVLLVMLIALWEPVAMARLLLGNVEHFS